MNITGQGRERKQLRDSLWGKPKGAATRVSANASKAVWEYRGIRFTGRRLVGWGAGREYIADGVGSAATKQQIMVKIDHHLDRRSAPHSTPR